MPKPAEEDVLAANAAFYAAFERHDVKSMEELWASEAPVACLHPGWEPLLGREAVLRSWRGILMGGGAPESIRCDRATVCLYGESAFVICTEVVPGVEMAATNFFVRERGRWRMTHHHSSPIARRVPPSDLPPEGGLPN